MDRPLPTRRQAVTGVSASLLACGMAGKSRAAPRLEQVAAMTAVTPPAPVPAGIGWHAFAGTDTAGTPRTLADWRGHAVLLNVWATWCGPCVAEMPALAAFAPRAAAAGIAVLPVSIDFGGAPAVRAFFARAGITGLPVLVEADASVRGGLHVGAVPVSFLFGADGMLRGRLDAAADWTDPGALARLRGLLGA